MKKLTLSQRIMFGGLGIVVAAWVVDQFIGDTHPRTAHAAVMTVDDAGPPLAEVAVIDVDTLIATLSSSPNDRPPLDMSALRRDPFELSETMLVVATAPAPEISARRQTEEPLAAKKTLFSAQHKLNGVLAGPEPAAIIDRRVIRLGAVVDGYKLTQIRRESVVFRSSEDEVVLHVDGAGGR